MRYKRMPVPAKASVTVPQLSGGMNLNDAPNTVNDNQLTDSRNMWWHRNALRTRPGLAVEQEGKLTVVATGNIDRFYTSNPISERETMLGQMLVSSDGKTGAFRGYALDLEKGIASLGRRMNVTLEEDGGFSSFGVKASKGSETDYYFFLSDGTVLQQGPEPAEGLERELVTAEPYVPLVMVNGRGVANYSDLETAAANGDVYEGYNRLTSRFKCSFTTDGSALYFPLPRLTQFNPDDFSYTYTFLNQTNNTVETFDPEETSTQYNPEVFGYTAEEGVTAHPGVRIGMSDNWMAANAVILLVDDTGSIIGQKPLPSSVQNNNLVITLKGDKEEERDSICRMTRCVWFGGDRSGIGGGTRLFVTGHPDKPNLVCWSDVNNPLYFPENNYAYIGDGAEAVTGFGKQGELLILFKEHEIYAAQYVAGDDDDYEFAEAGGVEITTYMAKFPITPLHSSIGCDCPDTIRLVNNRLVWADSTGRVYMLPTVNQYNERNVREISPNIRPLLRQHSTGALKKAVAGEYCGYYTLLVDNSLYLLDTQNSAFVSFNYYSKENEAQRALPWYAWTLDPPLTDEDAGEWLTMVSDGARSLLLRQPQYTGVYGAQVWKLYGLEGDTDAGEPIPCHFTTKLWDFDRPDYKKSVEQLYVGADLTPGGRVRIAYVTEKGTFNDAYAITDRGTITGEDVGYIRRVRLSPNVRMVQVFGIRFESDAAMAVDGILIKVRQQGVVR